MIQKGDALVEDLQVHLDDRRLVHEGQVVLSKGDLFWLVGPFALANGLRQVLSAGGAFGKVGQAGLESIFEALTQQFVLESILASEVLEVLDVLLVYLF